MYSCLLRSERSFDRFLRFTSLRIVIIFDTTGFLRIECMQFHTLLMFLTDQLLF